MLGEYCILCFFFLCKVTIFWGQVLVGSLKEDCKENKKSQCETM